MFFTRLIHSHVNSRQEPTDLWTQVPGQEWQMRLVWREPPAVDESEAQTDQKDIAQDSEEDIGWRSNGQTLDSAICFIDRKSFAVYRQGRRQEGKVGSAPPPPSPFHQDSQGGLRMT